MSKIGLGKTNLPEESEEGALNCSATRPQRSLNAN